MATISPVQNGAYADATVISWTGLSTADTATAYEPGNAEATVMSVQMEGTWGAATVVMQVSNDGTNWFTANDVHNAAVSMTADGWAEMSTAALYIRPSSSGGTADNVNISIAMRG